MRRVKSSDSTMVESKTEGAEIQAPTTFAITREARTSEAILDERVADFRRKLLESGKNYGEACLIARELRDVHWQQRTIEGRPRYKSFAQFAKAELGLGHAQVYAMIDVAEKGLANDAALHGLRFAKLLAAAPEQQREELRDHKMRGATNAELAEKAKAKPTKATPKLQGEIRLPRDVRIAGTLRLDEESLDWIALPDSPDSFWRLRGLRLRLRVTTNEFGDPQDYVLDAVEDDEDAIDVSAEAEDVAAE